MTELIAIYLQDHHAGAVAGLALARRAAKSNRESTFGDDLASIASEIEDDLRSLERIMDRLGIKPDGLKDRAAWIGEKLGRLKRNGTWLEYSPLSRLVELEGLAIGVTGKQALWEAMSVSGQRVGEVDLQDLAARAADQRERLEALRRRGAAETFGPAQD